MQTIKKPTLRSAARMSVSLLVVIGIGLAVSACQSVAGNRACGVITDSLGDVNGRTSADQHRIDVHFERGVAAGCWARGSAVGASIGGKIASSK